VLTEFGHGVLGIDRLMPQIIVGNADVGPRCR
jgi:hypothetical protein